MLSLITAELRFVIEVSLFHCFIAYIFIVLLLLLCFVQRMSDCTKLFYVYNYNMSCIILLYCGSYLFLYFSLHRIHEE